MEKHMQYLTWVKSKAPVTMGSTSLKRSREEEELGFAEDIGGGGFVWPPRSYSCTFCRREFRSAQALGGHMNVHRRDRARLKQSLTLHQKITTPLSSTNLLHFHDLQDGNFSSKRVTRSGNSSSRRKELGSSSNAIVNNNEEFNNYKRHKKGTISSSVGFLHKQCSSINNRYIIQPEGLRIIKANNNLSLEDIDLELRLG